ncbi:MAG: sensor histidine kinase [Frankia sp.]
MARWPLRRRLTAALLVTTTILAAGAAGLALSLVQLNRAINQGRDIMAPSRMVAADLVTSVVDQETGLRGYLITGGAAFLAPYVQGRATQVPLLQELDHLIGNRPGLGPELADLRDRIFTWERDYADPVARAAQAGKLAAARAIQPHDIGKAQFDALRAAYTVLDQSLALRSDAARQQVLSAMHHLVVLLAVVGFVFIVLMVLIARALRVWVTTPLGRIGADVREVADGRIEHPVRRVGPPDVAALAGNVEEMRLQLLRELEAVRAASEALEVQAVKLSEQAETLQRSNRDLEQFAYVASHDLQEPLRKVASFCQLLERRYGDKLDERGTQYIAFAVDGAKRMQNLINDLLTFSRVGRTTDQFAPVRLEDALSRATAALSLSIEAAGAEITHDELPTVDGDPTLLAAVFQNLISNAVKFRREDETPRIHFGVVEHDSEWELSCADNGIGVEAAYADKIFVIFQRLHSKEAYGGTGIGLALVRKIVEFHGGQVWLDTTVATGTTFRWTLPRSPARRPPAALENDDVRATLDPTGGTST